MTNDEYQQLLEFLGGKFDEVDRRFESMDRRFEAVDVNLAETRRHFDVVAEGLRGEIQQVAEGHQFLVDGQARIMDRMDRMERELGAMIRFSYAELDRRIRTLEEGFATLQERVARVETRQS